MERERDGEGERERDEKRGVMTVPELAKTHKMRLHKCRKQRLT